MTRRISCFFTALALCVCLLTACGAADTRAAHAWPDMQPTHSMQLRYAAQFRVDYYDGGAALITIADTDRYLLLPEGAAVPDGLDSGITVLHPPKHIYLAASSAMDFFHGLNALDSVRLTSTKPKDWSLPAVRQALESGSMRYAGKYSAPDYELLLSEGCDLAIESTMIYHNPAAKEQLERLGIPVLTERSSYESHPLGRMEWIRLYGLLLGKSGEADAFFSEQAAKLDALDTDRAGSGKTVAFFSVSPGGYVTVRKPGDYISKMIELAGGRYFLSAADVEPEKNALSTMNMQMEAFYAAARSADVLIYNSAIEGELQTVGQLLDKSPLLADCPAVQSGNVWCTGKNMFQQTTGAADMIADLHAVISGGADTADTLTFLHRLK